MYETPEAKIREENGHQPSVNDQVKVVPWFNRNRYTVPDEREARTSTVRDGVEERVDHGVRDILDNLEDIGVLEVTEPPGTDNYIRHHRTEKNFFPRFDTDDFHEMRELLEEERSRLLSDIHEQSAASTEGEVPLPDGGERPVGEAVAEKIEHSVDEIERWLLEPNDLVDRISRFDGAVKAIDDDDDAAKGRDYEAMGWRSVSLKWSLSEEDTARMRNQSL